MITVIGYLFLALLFLVLYLIFAPMVVEIDSRFNIYRMSIVPVFSIQWVPDDAFGKAEVKILGFRNNLLNRNSKPVKKVAENSNNKPSPFPFKITIKKMIAVLRTFKVKKWLINLDSGDMAMNGCLYPLFYGMQRLSGRNNSINFCGVNEIIINIENNAFRMLMALTK